MRSFVTFVLLALLGAIAAFLLSNNTPIALTFLGMTSFALPLSLWMAAALLAGVATGLWFIILFRLAERRGARQERDRRSASFGPDDFAVVDKDFEQEAFSAASAYGEARAPDSAYRDDYYQDRYDEQRGVERDRRYDEEYDRRYGPSNDPSYGPIADSPSLDPPRRDTRWPSEANDFPQRSREAEFEMVDANQPVYDANYRVIQPPEPEDSYGERASRSTYSDSNSSTDYGIRDNTDSNYDTEAEPKFEFNRGYGAKSNESEKDTAPRDEVTFSRSNRDTTQSEAPSKRTARASSDQNPPPSQPADDWDIESDLDW